MTGLAGLSSALTIKLTKHNWFGSFSLIYSSKSVSVVTAASPKPRSQLFDDGMSFKQRLTNNWSVLFEKYQLKLCVTVFLSQINSNSYTVRLYCSTVCFANMPTVQMLTWWCLAGVMCCNCSYIYPSNNCWDNSLKTHKCEPHGDQSGEHQETVWELWMSVQSVVPIHLEILTCFTEYMKTLICRWHYKRKPQFWFIKRSMAIYWIVVENAIQYWVSTYKQLIGFAQGQFRKARDLHHEGLQALNLKGAHSAPLLLLIPLHVRPLSPNMLTGGLGRMFHQSTCFWLVDTIIIVTLDDSNFCLCKKRGLCT